jgi:trehalose-phosphatase
MTESLAQHKRAIVARCDAAAQVFLALDFDGTLVRIREQHDQPRLLVSERRYLQQLANNPRFTVCFLSGRSVSDLEQRVAVKGAYYVGNHGLQIRRAQRWLYKPSTKWAAAVRYGFREISKMLPYMPGALIENKGIVLAVHYRRCPKREWLNIERMLKRVLRTIGRQHGMRLQCGKAIVEMRPKVAIDKGWGMQWVRRQAQCLATTCTTIAIGDDLTDEDFLRRVTKREGYSVHVGNHDTVAHLRARSTTSVWSLLRAL